MLKLPVIGSLVQAAIVERVCRVLASLVTAGVDLPRALAVTAESSNNAVYSDGINHIREQMMEGAGLADPLAETGLFPAAARQMFRVGEETGTLDKQLETAASFYHRELELKVKHFTSLFEPAVIIFMGVIVGFVAVALVSAMYGIYRQVKISEILFHLSFWHLRIHRQPISVNSDRRFTHVLVRVATNSHLGHREDFPRAESLSI